MWPGERPEAIDTRLVFRIYAMLGVLGGLVTLALAVWWLRRTATLPSGVAATTYGLVGTLNWTFALCAMAFSSLDDPAARLRSLKVFAAAHVVTGGFLFVLQLQFASTWTRLDASMVSFVTPEATTFFTWMQYRIVSVALFVNGAVLAYIAYTAHPGPRFSMTMRSVTDRGDGRSTIALRDKSRGASTRRLRSQFEEQIRQAARREERARLARDLHDAVKQQLFVIQTAAATVQARIDTDAAGAREALDQVRTGAREALTEMAAMLDQLQAAPIENVGLVEALKKQCEALGFRTGADVTLDTGALPPAQQLPPGTQDALFRVAQEALANIGRHARARRVNVTLREAGGDLALTIADDGAGFDPVQPGRSGMGIENMQARAAGLGGRLEIASSPGRGTTIALTVPRLAHSPRRYLMTAAACGIAFVTLAVLTSQGAWPWRALLFATTAITGIAFLRNAVAFYRVRLGSGHA